MGQPESRGPGLLLVPRVSQQVVHEVDEPGQPEALAQAHAFGAFGQHALELGGRREQAELIAQQLRLEGEAGTALISRTAQAQRLFIGPRAELIELIRGLAQQVGDAGEDGLQVLLREIHAATLCRPHANPNRLDLRGGVGVEDSR